MTERAHLAVAGALGGVLGDRGLVVDEPEHEQMLDVHEVELSSWKQLEALLVDAYLLSARAFGADATVIYVLDEASPYGHLHSEVDAPDEPAPWGPQSRRGGPARGVHAHAVTLDDRRQVESATDAVLWLRDAHHGSRHVIHCGTAHIGRPPA